MRFFKSKDKTTKQETGLRVSHTIPRPVAITEKQWLDWLKRTQEPKKHFFHLVK